MAVFISALMRTRNEEINLQKSLPNWLDFADEVVICDAGSTDNTKQVAEDLAGDKLVWVDFEGDYIGDGEVRFSHAGQQLNAGLEACSGQWIVTQDADTIFCEQFCVKIREELSQAKYDAYVMFGVHMMNDWESYNNRALEGPGVPQVFRNLPHIRFPDKPDEAHLIELPDDQVGVLDFGVFHWGYMDAKIYAERLQGRLQAHDDDDLQRVFSEALAHISVGNRKADTRLVPWYRCHAGCGECWMKDQALRNREGMWE